METKRALTGTKTSQGFSLYYRNTKLTACCGVIGRVRESRNPKKVIRVALMESYGEIGRVPVNLFMMNLIEILKLHMVENYKRSVRPCFYPSIHDEKSKQIQQYL